MQRVDYDQGMFAAMLELLDSVGSALLDVKLTSLIVVECAVQEVFYRRSRWANACCKEVTVDKTRVVLFLLWLDSCVVVVNLYPVVEDEGESRDERRQTYNIRVLKNVENTTHLQLHQHLLDDSVLLLPRVVCVFFSSKKTYSD